jgi:hypothetical protein
MNASTVTGYAFDADVYCPDCIQLAVAQAPFAVRARHKDGEPNPIFAGDETDGAENCRTCGGSIFTSIIKEAHHAT